MLQLVGFPPHRKAKQIRRQVASFAARIAAVIFIPSVLVATPPVNGQAPGEPTELSQASPFQNEQSLEGDPLKLADAERARPGTDSSQEFSELLSRLEKVELQLAAQGPKDKAPAESGEMSSSVSNTTPKSSAKESEPGKDAKEGADPKTATEKKSGEKKEGEKAADDEWTDLSSEKWTVKLGGHMQADMVHWVNADDPPIPARNYFEFRRLRLLADGTGYGVFDFRIQIDIEPESEDTVTTPVTTIKDAYATMHEVALLQRIRIGNFFVPFSLEQVTNDTNNIFMERSIPTQGIFAADREVGFAFYGTNSAQDVTWTGGIFLDSISEALKERLDDNQGHRLSWRTTWLPYYDEPSNGRYMFHTGIGILHTDDQDDVVRISARPQIHEGPRLIDSGNVAANAYTTGNLEFATVWGPVSVQSELFLSHVNGLTTDSSKLYGAYTYFSYFLTGENRIYDRYGQHGAQFSRNVPRTNFFFVPGGIGSGAWEAKARMSYLDLNELNAGRYHDFTVGLNWYWTDRIRMMFDWIHPMTTADTTFGDRESDLLATRFDINF